MTIIRDSGQYCNMDCVCACCEWLLKKTSVCDNEGYPDESDYFIISAEVAAEIFMWPIPLQKGYFVHEEFDIIMNIPSIYEIILLKGSALKVCMCSCLTAIRILWSVDVYWGWLRNIRKKNREKGL
jgi:hypothetical protein